MKEEKLSVNLKIRFSPTDVERIKKRCEMNNIKCATWIREVVLKEIKREK